MPRLPASIAGAVKQMWHTRDELRLANIRAAYLPYTFAMPMCLGIANMMSSLFRGNAPLWGLDPKVTLYCAYLFGAFLFFFVPSKAFIGFARIASWMAGAALAAWLVLPNGAAQSAAAMACWFALGACVFCATYAYMLVINNTERFFAALVITVNYSLCLLLEGLGVTDGQAWKALPVLFLLAAVICILRFEQAQFLESFKRPVRKADQAMYPAFMLFIMFFLMDAFISFLYMRGGRASILRFGMGAMLGGALAMLIQMVFKRSIWHVWNVYFVLLAVSFALMQSGPDTRAYAAGAFLCGLCTVGYAAAFYTFGGVMKKFGSLRLFKKCMCCICLPALIAAFVGAGLLQTHHPDTVPATAMAVAAGCLILYVLFSPAFQKHLFAADWLEDYHRPDMSALKAHVQKAERLAAYRLTPREKEVCLLLLTGLSRKQIALKLNISHATVSFHCTALYKKLNINSLNELFALIRADRAG